MTVSRAIAAAGKAEIRAHGTGLHGPISLALALVAGAAALFGWVSPTPSLAGQGKFAEPEARAAGQAPVQATTSPAYAVKLIVAVKAGEGLDELLERAGVEPADALKAADLAGVSARPAHGTEISLMLGDRGAKGSRALQGLSYRPQMDLLVEILRDEGGTLRLATRSIAVDATPRRFRGRAGGNLYWSMRAAGVPSEIARDYLQTLSDRLGAEWKARPDDRFDLVVDHRLAATGETRAGPILYAALDRASAPALRLVRWTIAGEEGLYEPGRKHQLVEGLHRPVSGPVTSRFGQRAHPILGFRRLHRGVDFRAAWGSPVHAVADGTVATAGWRGGYGRQVRLVHGNGLETSYSHLSATFVAAGSRVRKGQLIGHVGSSGLSTGPHLHYEVTRNGNVVDPLSLRHVGRMSIDQPDLAALSARLDQLKSI